MQTPFRILCALAVTLLLTGTALGQNDNDPAPAPASETAASAGSSQRLPFGVRAGYTSWKEVNHFHFGGHANVGELFPNVELTPGFELGLGDDWTILTINGDLTYSFSELVQRPWKFYAGGSLSFNYFNPKNGGSESHLGLSALGGFARQFANGHEGLAEVRFGLLDSPGFKLTFGYTIF